MKYDNDAWMKAGLQAMAAGRPDIDFRKACYREMMQKMGVPEGEIEFPPTAVPGPRSYGTAAEQAATAMLAFDSHVYGEGPGGATASAMPEGRAKGFGGLSDMVKAAVGQVLQGVPFSSSFAGLIPSNLRPDDKATKAVWSTAYVNDLPDGAFLHIMPGGKRDATGRTTPRSLRKFPVRNAKGQLDAAHVRNAIAQAPKANGMSPTEIASVQRRASDLLGRLKERMPA